MPEQLLKINKIKPENQNEFCRTLFALVVYKNKYPRDFSELHYDKGIISEVFRKKIEILQKKISEKFDEIEKKEELIESAKKEKLKDLKELRMLFVAGLFKKQTNAISFQNYSPELFYCTKKCHFKPKILYSRIHKFCE